MMPEAGSFTARQFAKHFWRVLWALARLERKLPLIETHSGLAELNRDEVLGMVRAADVDVKLALGVDWRSALSDPRGGWRIVAQGLGEIIQRHEPGYGELWIQNLYATVVNAVRAGQGILDDDLEFRLGVAQAELGFWTHARDLAALPGEAFEGILHRGSAIVAGAAGAAGAAAGEVASGTVGGILSGLLKNPLGLGLIALALYWAFGRGDRK